MAARQRWTEEERRELLAEHEASGLSLWAFARAVGVSYTTLAAWRRRGLGTATGQERIRLLPVEVDPSGDAGVEVVVGDVVLRLSAGFDESVLVRAVRALRAC